MSNNSFLKHNIDVLIVEDEIVLAMVLEETLKVMNFNVSAIATTEQEALTYSFEKIPDIVLMDINLNGNKSGIEIGKKIWQNLKIPIVFLTSYSNDKIIKKAMEAEPYAYLIKPCKDKELKATINTSLHKHNYFFKTKSNYKEKQSYLINCIYDFSFDKSNSKLFKKDKEITLTKKEKMFFQILCERPGEIISVEKIIYYIYRETTYDLGKLRTLVYRLRTKIGENIFKNHYDSGYKLILKNKKN